uniref:Uncharacterized protein n=1 Tax=Parascaris equorum TaxID=6256 RepID=A0A914R3C6_PAREQ
MFHRSEPLSAYRILSCKQFDLTGVETGSASPCCWINHDDIADDGIVCRQRLRIGKRCVQRNGRVICCCIRRKICEQMESQIANIINAADKNKVIDWNGKMIFSSIR